MGKRGPQPKGDYENKSVVFSTRLRPDTKGALEEAARASGRSLSQEVERRLRRSFEEDEKIERLFGGRQTFAMLQTLATALKTMGVHAAFVRSRVLPEGEGWLSDPYAFDQAVRAANTILEAFRPPGDPTPPFQNLNAQDEDSTERVRFVYANLGAAFANGVLDEVAKADGDWPLPGSTPSHHYRDAPQIKGNLGPLAERLKKEDNQ